MILQFLSNDIERHRLIPNMFWPTLDCFSINENVSCDCWNIKISYHRECYERYHFFCSNRWKIRDGFMNYIKPTV